MNAPVKTPIEPTLIQRLTGATRYLLSGQANVWFGPQQPTYNPAFLVAGN